MKYSLRPFKGQKWQVGLFKYHKGLSINSLSIHSWFDYRTRKMPRKNKVHVSAIEVQEFDENEISSESPTLIEEVITEIPRTTGQKFESHLSFLQFTFE